MNFKLKSNYKPTEDQKHAIEQLKKGVENGVDYQTLLGVTGSGKTFTVANLIQETQKPALLISHNKTLAAQLYQELKDFFPENAVSYFVSYYDYYQPEAYIPSTDTYIEKDADVNELIDKLRLAATTNLMTRKDIIVIASVSCIYNIGSPKEYGNFVFDFYKGMPLKREQAIKRLIDLQYERAEFGFHRGTFRVRGDIIDVHPAYLDDAIRVSIGDKVEKVQMIESVSGKVLEEEMDRFVLYPAKHYITDPSENEDVFKKIRKDLVARVKQLKEGGKELEAHRLNQKVKYELEMIEELGYVKGIENYSRYFDGRKPGERPYTLIDYFNNSFGDDWLTIVDESHITFPQIGGMYNGDLARKKVLIDYGFRLPAALDNRPLKFDEFMDIIPGFLAVSATPGGWEMDKSHEAALRVTGPHPVSDYPNNGVVEQLLRPTGIADPEVDIRPTDNQVADVIEEIKKRAEKGQRTLVTTLTKRMAEDLAEYLKEKDIKVHYLHSDIQTLERTDILDDLRRGNYDCLIGINLLREGLDLPEVSLVAILDADKEGFLRSEVTLIQTMGRAARHAEGEVIMYADKMTGSMERALKEVERRREYQLEMNKKLGITPTTIVKPIREKIIEEEDEKLDEKRFIFGTGSTTDSFMDLDADQLTPYEKKKLATKLSREMTAAAKNLNFELAAQLRDKVHELKGEKTLDN